jgi:hypothetical protein
MHVPRHTGNPTIPALLNLHKKFVLTIPHRFFVRIAHYGGSLVCLQHSTVTNSQKKCWSVRNKLLVRVFSFKQKIHAVRNKLFYCCWTYVFKGVGCKIEMCGDAVARLLTPIRIFQPRTHACYINELNTIACVSNNHLNNHDSGCVIYKLFICWLFCCMKIGIQLKHAKIRINVMLYKLFICVWTANLMRSADISTGFLQQT